MQRADLAGSLLSSSSSAAASSTTITASSTTTASASNTAMAMATCCCWFVTEIGGCFSTMSHPFARFRITYLHRLQELKALLPT